MGQHYLSKLFSPQSVAIIGASERPDSVGHGVFKNMLDSGYQGKLYAVNPNHAEILGLRAYASIEAIGEPVELAVIATRADTVPDLVEACGRHHVHAAIVLSAGFGEAGVRGAALERAMLANAKRHGLRVVGPNCLGLMRPDIGLNATFNKGGAKPGHLALVSQSVALCTAILDWAPANDIGFSSVVSMGASADVDFGEVLDYLTSDSRTESILLYIEGIHKARGFLSALRAAARVKPVFVIKVGRHAAGSRAVLTHIGALVGQDDVFDAALRRAGVVRVTSIGQMFSAAKALTSRYRSCGNRLSIVTNGGGPGVMATDHAVDLGIALTELEPATLEALNACMPPAWSHGNPLDILGDATAERYRQAVSACLSDARVDGVLVILTPQAMTHPLAVAQTMIALADQSNKPLLTCWMGDVQISESRTLFSHAKIPTFRTPESAVESFHYLSTYSRNQHLLMQTPGPLSHHDEPDTEGARMLIETVLAERRKMLSEMESKSLLAAFRIPVANTVVAHSPAEALLLAEQLGFPVAMKINSPDITHKSDAGGIRLNLTNAQAVRAAYNEILASVRYHRPTAHLDGVSIQPMVVKPNGRELMVGMVSDPVFGPVISFGAGGVAAEIIGDRAVALPPINRFLVSDLIKGTRISKLLGAFRHMPPIHMEALESVLLRVSEMVCELPWLREMDINPLIVDEQGALAADARVMVDFHPLFTDRYAHMAIYPYPAHLVSHWQLPDGTDITIRPIRPEDAKTEQEFVRNLSDEAKYFRFMDTLHELSQIQLVRFTQIDYDREMALIAITEKNGQPIQLGVARYATNPDGESCEFALAVGDDWNHKGIGHKLMVALMEAARGKGLKIMEGEVLGTNHNMLNLAARLGFTSATLEDDYTTKKVTKML